MAAHHGSVTAHGARRSQTDANFAGGSARGSSYGEQERLPEIRDEPRSVLGSEPHLQM